MIFYIEGTTKCSKSNSPVIDYIETLKDGKINTYTWDESTSEVDSACNYHFKGSGVSVDNDETGDDEYMNGRIDELKDCEMYSIAIVDRFIEDIDESFKCTSFMIHDNNEDYYVPLDRIVKEDLELVRRKQIKKEINCEYGKAVLEEISKSK